MTVLYTPREESGRSCVKKVQKVRHESTSTRVCQGGSRYVMLNCPFRYPIIIYLRVGNYGAGAIGIRGEDLTIRRVAEGSPTL